MRELVFPARAGMSPSVRASSSAISGFPRPRGDEPAPTAPQPSHQPVFPARAGMSPSRRACHTPARRFPRPRGDEPEAARLVNLDATFSPPARG